jgi:signal transduction histidine kinase
MDNFDARTAFLILGLFYLVMPTVTWIVLLRQRFVQVALWCGGGLLSALGSIMFAMQGHAPEVITLTLANGFFVVANLSKTHALRIDLGACSRVRELALVGLVVATIFLVLHYGFERYVLRAQFMTGYQSLQYGYIAALAWKIGKSEPSPSAKWIAGAHALLSLALLFRVITLLGRQAGDPTLMSEGLSTQLITLAGLLCVVIGYFGYVGMALDRSMRRELQGVAERARNEEIRRLGEQIAHLDRQRSLGEMSASLGHELKQPLTAILTNAQVANRGLQSGRLDTPQLVGLMERIVHNTLRATQIIERIRGFIRPSALRNESVNLRTVVSEVVALVADEVLSRKITVTPPDEGVSVIVKGDTVQLSQIVLNVLRNSIEAIANSDQREIWIDCMRQGEHAILTIRDSGSVLSEEQLARIGTPFFTTKEYGMGMGFSIARSIAIQHGGNLHIAAADVGGTIVKLELPCVEMTNS